MLEGGVSYEYDVRSNIRGKVKKKKGKQFPKQVLETQQGGMECRASILTLTFGTTKTAELSAVRAGRALPRRKFFGTHFC
jgi:hypothetical protein